MSFEVLACGSNGSGQLGLGHGVDVSRLAKSIFPTRPLSSRPVKIAAGGNHTLVLCEDGSLYSAGLNDNGRCGIKVNEQDEVNQSPRTIFDSVSFISDEGIVVDRFKFVAATWESSAFVTENGEVFTSGSGHSGELGQGIGVVDSPQPRAIEDFPPKDTEIVDIAACMRHTVVVLSNGEVYGWGAGRKRQLGEPAEKAIWSPRRLTPFKDNIGTPLVFAAQKAVCLRDFTYVLGPLIRDNLSERFYSICGIENGDGVIDRAPNRADTSLDIAATWRGIHVLSAKGRVSGWGLSRVPEAQPSIIAISAGSEHILVKTTDGKILAAGWGEHGNCGEPFDEKGQVDGWNEIASAPYELLGAGCATSWVFREIDDAVT